MAFIEGLPDEVVAKEILPKLKVPLNRNSQTDCDIGSIHQFLSRLRRCWATSSIWKSAIEDTIEWAAWRLARFEAQQFQDELNGPGYSLLEIDRRHPLYGKSDAAVNFKTNVNAFARSKAIWVHCKKHPRLTPRELTAPMKSLSIPELVRLRNVLTQSMRAIDKGSAGQTWVTPRDRLD